MARPGSMRFRGATRCGHVQVLHREAVLYYRLGYRQAKHGRSPVSLPVFEESPSQEMGSLRKIAHAPLTHNPRSGRYRCNLLRETCGMSRNGRKPLG